ncbi:MAG TPA: cell division protein FtsH [Solibacterales bacterium]|nr:cell division protein FtsH [Bryobacterales bacterium]
MEVREAELLGYFLRAAAGKSGLRSLLGKHFGGLAVEQILTASRDFPVTSRVDVQSACNEIFAAREGARLLGVSSQVNHETATLASFLTPGPWPSEVSPLQHDEVDIGDDTPVRCLKNGLWLAKEGGLPFAVLLSPAMQYGQVGGSHVEIGVPSGEEGADFSARFFRDLEVRVTAGRTYRGRVLSLEQAMGYGGLSGAVKVHRLRKVEREEVILPRKTLDLLDRNVGQFVAARERIKQLRFSARKGLLFHGPPGTGKTHTIHYLASQLPGHTTLLITAEQVASIGEYFRLARFLAPSMMVIEDVDLIARERENMANPMQEVMLNKLLNEMDGLREDADVLVILTTNRPDQLEPALAARPGRIDQAIEFPLPDDEGRRKLAMLYSRGIEVPDEVVDLVVRRTAGGSAAFIKELMRRSAQFEIEASGGAVLSPASVEAAMEEMVFSGGAVNLKLLGGPGPGNQAP